MPICMCLQLYFSYIHTLYARTCSLHYMYTYILSVYRSVTYTYFNFFISASFGVPLAVAFAVVAVEVVEEQHRRQVRQLAAAGPAV